MARRMGERHEDLAGSAAGDPNIILHSRITPGKAVCDPQPFENPLRLHHQDIPKNYGELLGRIELARGSGAHAASCNRFDTCSRSARKSRAKTLIPSASFSVAMASSLNMKRKLFSSSESFAGG